MDMDMDRRCSKRKKRNPSSKPKKNSISELPDVIIQHIQSFLTTKQAARTSILSKSWLQAWSTRPFLDFNLNDIPHKKTLLKLIDTTLESYVEQGLSMVGLRLNVDTIPERWLQLVLQQSKLIELHLKSQKGSLSTARWQEIFLTKSLQVLRVDYQKDYRKLSHLVLCRKDIKCLNLKKLELRMVQIDEDTFHHIMCCCPFIEELLLRDCKKVRKLDSKRPETTRSLSYFEKLRLSFSKFCDRAANLRNRSFTFEVECASLKRLSLIDTTINAEGLQSILSKSPQLEDLTLTDHFSSSITLLNLSSQSLQRAIIVLPMTEIIIDAPNLHSLKYTLHCDPTALFPTITSPVTKGEINVKCGFYYQEIGASWFLRLRELLSNFAKSDVKFLFNTGYHWKCNFEELEAAPLPHGHQVESLTFRERFPSLPLLYAFFTISHPKTILFVARNKTSNLASLRNLCKDLSRKGNLECCKLDQNKCWRHYIKDAKLYHVVNNEQKPLDMNDPENLLTRCRTDMSLALEWYESSDNSQLFTS